ncbi:MAG: UDP-glucuronate decarboxylase, partial [uncultured Gemmatimonadaceae bacterium]
ARPRHRRRRLPRLAPRRPLPRRGARGRRARQLHHRAPRERRAPRRPRAVPPRRARHLVAVRARRPVRRRAAPGVPGQPPGLPRAPDRDAARRRARDDERARDRPRAQGAVLPRVHVRGLRRPARAPADRGVLGEREPGGAAQLLRRGEAVRRGDDDGLPPRPRGRHAHRPHLQHLRPADAPERRARGVEPRRAGAARRAAHRVRRRLADAQLLLRVGRGGRDLPPVHARRRGADEHRQPAGVHGAGARRAGRRAHRDGRADRRPPAPRRRPQAPAPRHQPGPRDARVGAAGGRAGGARGDDRVLPRRARRRPRRRRPV